MCICILFLNCVYNLDTMLNIANNNNKSIKVNDDKDV